MYAVRLTYFLLRRFAFLHAFHASRILNNELMNAWLLVCAERVNPSPFSSRRASLLPPPAPLTVTRRAYNERALVARDAAGIFWRRARANRACAARTLIVYNLVLGR